MPCTVPLTRRTVVPVNLSGRVLMALTLLQSIRWSAQKAFAERVLLLDENRLLFEQNNESNCRQSTRSTVVGKAKVMSYEDIVEAQTKRDAKEAVPVKGKRGPKRKSSAPVLAEAKSTRKSEVEVAILLIRMKLKHRAWGITVLFYNSHDTLEHFLVP